MSISQLGAGTGGVWTAAQAHAAGMSRWQVSRRLGDGTWQSLRRGVYADAGVVPDARMRGWAAVLAGGGPGRAVAAGRTAARLLGLPLVEDDDPLLPTEQRQAAHDDVAVRRVLRPAHGLHPARLTLAGGDGAVVLGVPSLSPLRTLVDLARLLPHPALVCAVDAALHRRLVTEAALAHAVARRAGAPHGAVLAAAVRDADGRAESPLETLSRLLLLPVLPGLVPQVVVLDRVARPLARLDLGDEALLFGVEADGGRYHAGTAALAHDRARERRVAALGWALERVTWADVRRDGARTRARVLAAAQAHAARRAA